jgi:hypothetical protein
LRGRRAPLLLLRVLGVPRAIDRVVHPQACRRRAHVAHERLQHVQRRAPELGAAADGVGLGRQRQRGGGGDRADLVGDVREVLLVVQIRATERTARARACVRACVSVCVRGRACVCE